MLRLRPGCEHCDCDLPPESTEAMIRTYECTFCADCVAHVLADVCPNCGGGFVPRPVRPDTEWLPGVSGRHQPPSTERVHRPVDLARHDELRARVGGRPPAAR